MSTIRKFLLLIFLAVPWSHSDVVPYRATHERDALVRAVGRCRLIEGRFTGGFEYALYKRPISRSAKISLTQSARRGKLRAPNNSSPKLLADSALLGVFGSDLTTRILNRSIGLLERATRSFPNEPDLLSDLSALLIARGELNSDPYDFVLAVAASSKALARDSFLAEAQFNLALALDHLFLEGEACRAWDRYLQIDDRSDWADEARVRCRRSKPVAVGWERARAQLESASMNESNAALKKIVREFPRSARLYAEKQLLGDWASAAINGLKSDSTRSLRLARALGAALEQQGGDRLVSRATSEILAALEKPEGKRLPTLMRGYYAYAEGLQLSDRDLDDRALSRFEEAVTHLTQVKSPFRYRAQLKYATCLYYLGKPEESLAYLVSLASRVDARQYPTLTGEILWIQGLSYSKLANFSAAHRVYKDAEQLFSSVGEQENIAFLHFLLAESLRYQGQPRKALWHLSEALKTIGTMGRTLWYHNSLLDSAEIALSEKLDDVALYFQNEMVEGSLKRKDPITIAESLLRRARTLHRLNDLDSALNDLANARTWSMSIESEARGGSLQADIAMVSAEIQRTRGNFDAAIASLDSAVEEAKAHDRMFRLPDLYEAQGFAHLDAGDEQLAESHFRSAIDELSNQRERLDELDLRASHFERSQRVFSELIRLKLRRNKSEEAFQLVEESRSRALLDALTLNSDLSQGRRFLVLSGREIRRSLPSEVVLVEYAALKDGLIAFVVSRDYFEVHEINGDREALRRKIETYVKAVRTSNRAVEWPLARELFNILILPALRWTRDASLLILVPDQFLHVVPFAALVNPRSNRYLIEEISIALAPSATAYVQLRLREQALRSKPVDRLLVVSDPEIDRQQFPDLVTLRGAEEEGRSLAALAQVEVLTGAAATPKALTEMAPQYTIVHIAAHARPNRHLPLQSTLILAPEVRSTKTGSGLLLARDISRLRLYDTRLVVLAACESGGGQVSIGEGIDSLARSFLVAGVPSVVASLWNVEDGAAAGFFFEFHQALRRGDSIPNALRRAQLRFLESDDKSKRSPQAWSGFHILGGVSF